MKSGQPRYEIGQDCVEEVFIFPASFAQQRLWFMDQLLPNTALYSIPLVFRLTGSLHRSALEQSIQAIVARHESLRTSFEVIEGQLVQVVSPVIAVSLTEVDLQQVVRCDREEKAFAQIRQEIQQPFNLKEGSLLRVKLWHLEPDQHLLLILLHHIIFDEWSSGVLIRELGAVYAALLQQKSAELGELSIQYADFAHWQREWLQGNTLNTQLNYWRQQLKDVPSVELPNAAPRPAMQRYQGASQLLEFPQSLLDALEELSQQAGVTLFMTLLAAFQTLLHRYTGQTDITIGSPIANRHRSELEGLIGFLVNTLVLRSDLSGDPTFRELLDRVRSVTLAAYDHQDLPFEKLVEELQPVRSLTQNPLFQIVFALQNTPIEQLELPGLTLSAVEFETQTTRFDLEVYVWKSASNFRSLWGTGWQQSDGLRGVVIYNTDLFEAEAIASFRQHFKTLLTAIVANPDARLSTLSLLTAEEQNQAWSEPLQTQIEYPANCCIPELFQKQVLHYPNAIALQCSDQQFTYEELDQGSNQLARYLQQLGVQAETRVGICLDRPTEAIAAMLAILKAGGTYVPLDASYPPERIQFLLNDAEIGIVLTQESRVQLFASHQRQIVCLDQEWEAIAQQSTEAISLSCTANSLAYVIYTSGSTGTPKGVMVPHRGIVRLVCNTDYVQISPETRIAQVANLAFDAATFEIWGALLNGGTIVAIDRETTLSPIAFAHQLQHDQINILFLTTALLNQIVSQVPDAFRSLDVLLFGGETANVDRVREVLTYGKPKHLLHVYGPTENTTFSTWYEVDTLPETASSVPIGRAIANTQAYLLDEHLQPVPIGISGELYLGGEGLARGYLNRPALTADRFIEIQPPALLRLYRTGDRARYRSDGCLEFLGRSDRQVKIRGFRVELGEIETVLTQYAAVQTAVVTVQERGSDRQLIAYVVPRSETELVPVELRSFLKTKLPAYMLPAAIVVLDAFPLTPNGKIDQRALPLPDLLAERETVSIAPPTTSLEQTLVELWKQLLGCEVGIHDNFFEAGGHSLLATQLVSRIRDRLQVEIPLRSVFETPTIATLAQTILSAQSIAQTTPINSYQSITRKREEIER